jgi:enoyl-CoA hydratase
MQEENKYENILYAKKDKVATITLNRQKSLNALNTALLTELRDALNDAETDAAVRAIVITGSGEKAFCAGADITELVEKSEKAVFGLPEINLAIIPGGGGTQRLPRLIGKTIAMEMLMSGQQIDAEEAFRLALVNKVVPADELGGEVDELIKKLLSKSAVTLGILKDAVNKGLEMDLEHALEYEAECFGQALATEDAREGLKAFLEKRE